MGKKRDFEKEEQILVDSLLHNRRERTSKSNDSSRNSDSYLSNTISDSSDKNCFYDILKDFDDNDDYDDVKSKGGETLSNYQFEKCIDSAQENLSSRGHFKVTDLLKAERVSGRSKDEQGRAETVSTVSFTKTGDNSGILSYRQDTFKYDTNVSKNEKVSFDSRKNACDVYHSHDGVNSKFVYTDGKLSSVKHEEFSHGPNAKVDKFLQSHRADVKDNLVDVSNLKNDDYTRFRMPQLDNDKNSNSSVCKEANSFLNEQKEKQQERDVYKEFFPELFTQKHANDMLQQFKDGKADEVREAEEKRYQEEMRERERELERQREADRIREEELERERKLEEKRQREEEREQENESRRCSCSWWYHDRCLKCHDEDYCYKCNDYDTSEHSCATCSSFDSCPGHTKSGDSWYGICTAYDGNPIRDNPSSHTCKAWN